MPLPRYTHALVRDPSPVYGAFYAARGISISDQLAHEQHEAYNDALREAGLKLVPIAPDPFFHDCVFIEDTAILWEKRALITRMNPLREGEQAAVRKWLNVNHLEIVTLPDDAKIEGGDVMHLEDETWVGLTERTNAAGVEATQGLHSPPLNFAGVSAAAIVSVNS